jgi:outer membrane protein OmpA-like peptidoglycan-associated protein
MTLTRSLPPALLLCTTAFAFLALPQPARAAGEDDEPGPRWEAGVYGGLRFFAEDHELRSGNASKGLSPKDAFTLGLRLAYNLNSRYAIEGEFQGTPTETANGATSMTVLAYRAHLVAQFHRRDKLRLFGLAGLGAISSLVSDKSVVPNDNLVMAHLGVGGKYAIGDSWGLRIDARVESPFTFLSPGYGGPDFEFLIGPYLTFGHAQRVATVDPDPDHDGILGDADKCPTRAEDKDAFEDEDGCPDPDNDRDGIADAQDKCPLEPETKNGFQDEDGCPDQLPAQLKKFTGVIEGIYFATGQATILPKSFPMLDKAAAVLDEFRDIRLEISGHTDNQGKAAYNQELSQRRAEAVKAYLVKKGIDEGRLVTVGAGMDRPIEDNGTAQGRARNRRTEFKLLTGTAE